MLPAMNPRLFTRWFLPFTLVAALCMIHFVHAQGAGQGVNRVNVLIGFRGGANAEDVAVLRAVGAQVKHTYRIVPAVAASVPEPALAGLARDPRVTVIEEDGLVFAIDHTTTSGDQELNNTWGVKHIGAGAVHPINTGEAIKVAVIDSGVDYNHPDLKDNYKGGRDFVNEDNDPMDDNSHGTHVAGTIAAVEDGLGVVGVAPKAHIYALKVLGANGSGSFSHVIAALQWCVDNEIQISNNSYGSSGDPGTILRNAFDNSLAAGVLHVAAAGNSGTRAGKGDNVGYPARYSSVIAVAATDSSNNRASFSSTGPAVEIAAPGVGIRSTVPGGGWDVFNGTSMASPHVAGVAALLIKSGITDPTAVRNSLKNSAIDLGTAGRDNLFGYGLVDVALGSSGPGGGDPGDGEPAGVSKVSGIEYSTSGGRGGTKDLLIRITVEDGDGNPIGGASVSMMLSNGGSTCTSTASTGADGSVTFKLGNAPSGSYSTIINDVTAPGFEWDDTTPLNEFSKP